MRTLDELIDRDDDAWPIIVDWTAYASRPVELASCDPAVGKATLLAVQVTTHSIMGAVALRCAGIRIDHGWLRVLGAGGEGFGGGLVAWNALLGGEPLDPPLEGALFVAYDVLGGFFAINGGAWSDEPGTIHYFSPDTCAWEAMGVGYSAFLEWAMSERLDGFYEGTRWEGWEQEVERVPPDHVLSIYPPLGFEPGVPVSERTRGAVPAREMWYFANELGRQLAGLPPGTKVQFEWTD